MNKLNYASLEASKRLVEAGIVLETDQQWYRLKNGDLYLSGDVIPMIEIIEELPAHSMAEVWRELPNGIIVRKLGGRTWAWMDTGGEGSAQHNTNPTDALIDLLIWVRKEAKDGR